ncbi:hypothetical protein OKW11_006301 [Pseudomonas baetica]|nr:hypothetical protein [Pseudomonas baetica]
MNPLLRNGIYIVNISLGGVLLAYLLFDQKPSAVGMFGCLLFIGKIAAPSCPPRAGFASRNRALSALGIEQGLGDETKFCRSRLQPLL